MKNKLSVVLATFNEEKNIGDCLDSVKEITNEIVIVDGSSSDKTREIAESFGAKVIKTTNPPIFHINKQRALQEATYQWILQLDADERLTPELSREILEIINMDDTKINEYQKTLRERRMFLKHQRLLEDRDGKIGEESEGYCGFFVPRLNFFLGRFLKHGGVYPDGVIRLVKNGKAWFPAKSVHEQIVVEGRVGWLANPLIHMADPTFARYLARNSRYIDLIARELARDGISKDPLQAFNYYLIKPVWWFLLTQIRHKGILDSWQGIIFSFFSALRFPRAYWRYLVKSNK